MKIIKVTTFLLTLLFLLVYGNNVNKYKVSLMLGNSKKDSLLGVWKINETVINKLSAYCNVCPSINFKSDGNGEVIMSLKIVQKFKWSLKNATLIIYDLKKNNNVFKHSEYAIEIKNQIKYIELQLNYIDNEILILRKRME